jgi:hypothetical protein
MRPLHEFFFSFFDAEGYSHLKIALSDAKKEQIKS